MKIYTKKGDKGNTSLYSGEKVSKNNEYIIAVGELDSLSVEIGYLYVLTKIDLLRKIQKTIENINSYVATNPNSSKNLPILEENLISELEIEIDTITNNLEPLRNFILPSNNIFDYQAHKCRVQTRRCERFLTSIDVLNNSEFILPYINRLSDYFFTLARNLSIL